MFLAPNGIWRIPGIILAWFGGNWAAGEFGVGGTKHREASTPSMFDASRNNRELLISAIIVVIPLFVLYSGREEYFGFHKTLWFWPILVISLTTSFYGVIRLTKSLHELYTAPGNENGNE